MNAFEKFLAFFREDKNIRNIETSSTILFVFIFIFYFYGFRTGFEIGLGDIEDMLFDMFVIFISSAAIIRSFAKMGMYAELDTNPKLKEIEAKHETTVNAVNAETISQKLRDWNNEQIIKKMRQKKEQEVLKYKRQLSLLMSMPKIKKRKVAKLKSLIAHYEHPSTDVKVKHHWVIEREVLSKGMSDRKSKEITTNYNVVRDVTASQGVTLAGSMILFAIIRVAIDPSVQSWQRLFMFLSIIIPFLIIRAIVSYLTARYKTMNTYRYALENKIRILEWCKDTLKS